MTTKKTEKIERRAPNPDTLEINMQKVLRGNYFPVLTAVTENERRHAGQAPEPESGWRLIDQPKGSAPQSNFVAQNYSMARGDMIRGRPIDPSLQKEADAILAQGELALNPEKFMK